MSNRIQRGGPKEGPYDIPASVASPYDVPEAVTPGFNYQQYLGYIKPESLTKEIVSFVTELHKYLVTNTTQHSPLITHL